MRSQTLKGGNTAHVKQMLPNYVVVHINHYYYTFVSLLEFLTCFSAEQSDFQATDLLN